MKQLMILFTFFLCFQAVADDPPRVEPRELPVYEARDFPHYYDLDDENGACKIRLYLRTTDDYPIYNYKRAKWVFDGIDVYPTNRAGTVGHIDYNYTLHGYYFIQWVRYVKLTWEWIGDYCEKKGKTFDSSYRLWGKAARFWSQTEKARYRYTGKLYPHMREDNRYGRQSAIRKWEKDRRKKVSAKNPEKPKLGPYEHERPPNPRTWH